MEIKNVPGLWKAVAENGAFTIIDNTGNKIASIEPNDDAAKNAFMVVNAPYMLEALKGLVALIGDDDLDDNGELSGAAVCDIARNAIALGLGRNS